MARRGPRIIGFAGWSGAGKTTLIEKLIPVLTARGVTVSTVKHAHHAFDLDVPGKDSWRHRQSGATEVMIASSARFALLHELRGEAEPSLAALLGKLAPVGLVLVEGFKRSPIPKIEVYRAANGKPLLFPDDPTIIAIASDDPIGTQLPVIGLDDVAALAEAAITGAVALDEAIITLESAV